MQARKVNALAAIRRGLREHEPLCLPDSLPSRSRAAVALVFGGWEQSPSLCFVKRAKRPGERWSGDMAFPGGWVSSEDAGAREAAVREAHEEVGLDLRDASYLGQLDDRRIRYAGDGPAPVLSSFVFYAGSRLPELRPDGWETESAYWISLEHLRCDAPPNRRVLGLEKHVRHPLPGPRDLGAHAMGVPVPGGDGAGRIRSDLLTAFPSPAAAQASSDRGMRLRLSLPSSVMITVSLNPAPYSPRRRSVRGRWNTIPAFSGFGLAAER